MGPVCEMYRITRFRRPPPRVTHPAEDPGLNGRSGLDDQEKNDRDDECHFTAEASHSQHSLPAGESHHASPLTTDKIEGSGPEPIVSLHWGIRHRPGALSVIC